MSKFGLLTQVGMIIIALAIGYLYIKPTITTIRETEDMTAVYQEEVDKVSSVNQLLANKVATIDAIPPGDTGALLRYLPDTVDDIAVMKDIVTIFTQTGVSNPEVSYKKDTTRATRAADGPKGELADVVPYNFEVHIKTTYPKLLSALSAVEVNNYLLQVSSLKIAPGVADELDVQMVLTAYALAALPVSAPVTP